MEYMLYLDNARVMADIAPDRYDGATGSNWQPTAMGKAEAEAWLADRLAEGYQRGHDWAPRF